MGIKVSGVLRKLQDDGWFLHATKDSHRQFKHLSKSGRVMVPGKASDDLAPGTLNSIYKQAGWPSSFHRSFVAAKSRLSFGVWAADNTLSHHHATSEVL